MLTFEQKKQELLARAETLKNEGKLEQSTYAHIVNTLFPRYDAWLSADPSASLTGRLAYLRGKANSFTGGFKRNYEQLISDLETNPQPEIEAMKIGLYITRYLDAAEKEAELETKRQELLNG